MSAAGNQKLTTRAEFNALTQKLLQQFKGGDSQAFTALYRLALKPVMRAVARAEMPIADVEDATQVAFETLLTKPPEHDNALGFLIITARFYLKESHKRNSRYVEALPSDDARLIAPDRLGGDSVLASKAIADSILAGVDTLSADQQAVLLLNRIEGLGLFKTAHAMGLTVEATQAILLSAQAQLAVVLAHKPGQRAGASNPYGSGVAAADRYTSRVRVERTISTVTVYPSGVGVFWFDREAKRAGAKRLKTDNARNGGWIFPATEESKVEFLVRRCLNLTLDGAPIKLKPKAKVSEQRLRRLEFYEALEVIELE